MSEFTFFYNNNQINVNKKTNVNVKDGTLHDVLDQIFTGTGYEYRIVDRQVLINPKAAPVKQEMQQQTRIITGVVVDDTGEPVIGANVIVKGTTNGTITDFNGEFSIDAPENAILRVSYIGYIEREVNTGNRREISIVLNEDTQALEEVVVVGYGVQKKVSLTGAISAVKSDEIVTTKNENVQNMLTGKVSGIRVVQKSAEPGSFNNDFDIRGMGSSLYVIDGVPRDNFNRLDPNDIESLTVLKDASAAIYGVRAANGVVLITTKKGQSGKVSLEYSGNVGWQNPSGSAKSVSAADWMVLKNESAMHNVNGGTPVFSQEEIDAYRNGTKQGADWWDEILRPLAPQTQHAINVTGGNENVQFFVSGGYLYQESFFRSKSLDYNKYNLRSNISANISKRLKVEISMSGIMDEKNQMYENPDWIIRAFQRAPATMPIYANNNPEYLNQGWIDGDNPIAMADGDISGYKKYQNKWFQSSATVSYDVPYIDGLVAKAMFSYDYQIADNTLYKREYELYEYQEATNYYNPVSHNSGSAEYKREFFSKSASLYQLSLNYNRVFNKSHNVTGLILLEGSKRQGDNFYAQRNLSIDLDKLFAGNSENQIGNMDTNKDHLYDKANLGLVGRVGYDYQSRYFAEFSFRQDGSSMFGAGKRWGFFPSASAGWRISEENFWKNSPLQFINNFKLRGSYGKMGDDSAAEYQYLVGYLYPAANVGTGQLDVGNNRLPSGYLFDGTYINSISSKGIANPNITWYIAKTMNIGVDGEAWNGLLGASFDFFTRKRTGLLATRQLSLATEVGATLPQENLNGDMTHGFEVELSHRNRIGDVGYNLKGLFSFARTKNTYEERARAGNSYLNWRNNNNDRYVNVHWGRAADGRYTSYADIANSSVYADRGTLPGDYIYYDWNGDGIISDLDVHPIAYEDSKAPFINFSLNIGAEWKGFDLNLLLQGAAMKNVKYIEQLREPLWGHENANALDYFMDRWHPVNPLTDPYDHSTQWVSGKYAYTGSLPDENSEFNIHNANYLRLKSIELGYTISRKVLAKTGIQGARIYVNGYNLLTFKSIELDPEHPNDSWGNVYPLNRTFSVGVNVKF